MIKIEPTIQVHETMHNLIRSMTDMQDYLAVVLEYIGEVLSPQREQELLKLFKKYNIPQASLRYNVHTLAANPYFRDIRLENVNTPTVSYTESVITKRTLINMGFHQPLGKYLFHYHPVGYFDTDVHLPALTEGDKIWMSPAPSEIASMQLGVENGHGHCLTFGLGIGVLPYLWLLKSELESVTVVEINADVIDLFCQYIQPQFKTNKKLNIIHGDVLDYYNAEFLSQFDYIYVDCWESNADGLELYTKLMEKQIYVSNIDYWIEDSILSDLKYIVASYLLTVYQKQSIPEFISSIDTEMKPYAKKVNRYFKQSDEVISTETQLLRMVNGKDILQAILAC